MAAVLPVLGGVVTAVSKLGEWLGPPIRRQVDYMCCSSRNIKDMQDQIEKLEDTKEGVQHLVRAARNNLEIIGSDVEKWLEKVDKIKEEADKLHGDTNKVLEGCIKRWRPNLKSRYQISRRAKKMSENAIQLQKEGKFKRVSYPAPPLGLSRPNPLVEMVTAPLQSKDAGESSEVISHSDHLAQTNMATPQLEDELNLRESSEVTSCPGLLVEMDTLPVQSADKPEPENKTVTIESDKIRSRKAIEDRIIATLLDSSANIIGLCGLGGVGKTTMARRIGKIIKEKELFDEVIVADVTKQQDIRKIQHEIAEMLGLKLEDGNTWARAERLRSRIKGVRRILIILDDIWNRLNLHALGIPSGTATSTCKILLTSRARDVCLEMGAEVILMEVLSGEEAWMLFSEIASIPDDTSDTYPIAKEVANECKGLPLALVSVARSLKHKSKHSWEDALSRLQRFTPTYSWVVKDVYQPLALSYSHLDDKEAQYLFLLCSLFREDSSISIEDLVRYGIGLSIFNGIISIREGRNRAHALVETLKDRFLLLDGHKEGYVKMHNIVRGVAISIASNNNLGMASYSDGVAGWWHWRGPNRNYTHISVFSRHQFLPIVKNFPNLVFLLWECEHQEVGDPNDAFQFKTLNVLHMNCMDLPALSSCIHQIKHLRALHLHGCKLENISFLGELTDLEILSFRGSCFKILPAGLGKLADLRLLELTDCEALKIIEQGAIAGLTKLEELYLTKSYAASMVDSAGGAILSELEKLCNLTSLRILMGDTEVVSGNLHFCNKLTEYDISIRASPGSPIQYLTPTANIPSGYARSFHKAMDIFLPTKTQLGEWIGALLQSTEDLRLIGDGSDIIVHKMGSGGFKYLKQLTIKNCNTVQQLATIKDMDPPCFGVFPILETLYLYQLPKMNQICPGQLPPRSFGQLRYMHLEALPGLKHIFVQPTLNVSLSKLRSIYIHQCQNLRSLFSTSVAQSLLRLEDLEIRDCVMMEKVFFHEGIKDGAKANKIEFPNLNKLVLRCLHRVTAFITKGDGISFPQLRVLKMEDLPRFTGFCPTKNSPISRADFQILFNTKVACQRIQRVSLRMLSGVSKIFGNQLPQSFLHELEFLEVDDCNGLNFIFSSSVARALVKLKKLIIKNCGKLMELLEKENKAQTRANIAFHQLEYLEVDACDRLETLFPPSVVQSLVKLRELRIKNCKLFVEVIEKEDRQVQANNDASPFPQLKYLELSNLPNAKKFWHTNYDFEITSLVDVIVNTNSPLMEQLEKIAKNAKQMIEYQKRHGKRASGTSSTPYGSYQGANSSCTTYASCQSYICPHKECDD